MILPRIQSAPSATKESLNPLFEEAKMETRGNAANVEQWTSVKLVEAASRTKHQRKEGTKLVKACGDADENVRSWMSEVPRWKSRQH